MNTLRKYGVETTVDFSLYQVDGIDFEPAATFAAGDIKIMKDEGVEANTTNLPTDEGQGYSLVLTATEMQAARIKLYIVDQTATKVWLDTDLLLDTYGHASAMHAFDLDTASTAQTADHTAKLTAIEVDTQDLQSRVPAALSGGRMVTDVEAISGSTTAADNLASSAVGIVPGSAIAGTLSSTQMSTNLTETTDDQYVDRTLIWTSGVLANSGADITAYNGTTKVLTFSVTKTGESPSNTDTFVIV